MSERRPEPDLEWRFILAAITMLAILLAIGLAHAETPPAAPPDVVVEPPADAAPPDVVVEPPADATPPDDVVEPPADAAPPDVVVAPPADAAPVERRTVDPDRVVIHEAPEVKTDPDAEDPEPKLSLPTEADRQAWQRPGFRLQLAASYGELVGLRGAPGGTLYAANLRAGLRLDATWSIMSSFQYALASSSGGLAGLRFAGTVDPTWHVTPNLAIAVGFGFGGIVEGNTTREDAMPTPGSIESSYTFPDASTPLAKCSGVGAAALARAEYSYVLGPRMAGTIGLEVVGQWTGCVDDTGRVEPDTGNAIVRRQWWPHTGATFSLGFAWR